MQAFMRSVKPVANNRESAIKQLITTQLSECVKDIQLCSVANEDYIEAGNNLCSVIEAIFLHGLKDSLANRFRKALSDLDQKPDPNFWSPLLVISHKQFINQINKLQQITTEVGQCRSWIRLAINDALLSSYFITIKHDSNALKHYYKMHAYIRDPELLEVAQKLIEGIEAIQLNVPVNSSLLNEWPLPTLTLAGIWAPTLRASPISSGVDIAQSMHSMNTASNSDTCSISSMISESMSSGIGQMLALNQDEALKKILAEHKHQNYVGEDVDTQSALNNIDARNHQTGEEHEIGNEDTNRIGNSLNRQSGGWSFDHENNEETPNKAQVVAAPMEYSFNALIESYNLFEDTLRKDWNRWDASNQSESIPTLVAASNDVSITPTTRTQNVALSEQINIIAKENGLDNQQYKCSGCSEFLHITPKPNVCAFSGEYFCDGCMCEEPMAIPARIIHNWDFKLYRVSVRASRGLAEIGADPLVDFKTANPLIYAQVDEMHRLQQLRNRLNYLRAYLYTCREPVIEQLQQRMWPREYMYEHIHQYSISDLMLIRDGTLASQLMKVVEFGTEHVLNCWLCSQKGFLCEICNQSKALFPFDTENVFRCNECTGVFHKSCLNASKPCPRCERKRKRDDTLKPMEDIPTINI